MARFICSCILAWSSCERSFWRSASFFCRAAEFWAKYQNVIFALAALLILATAGYRFYEYRRLQAAEAAGAAFQDALKLDRDGKAADAAAAFAKLSSDSQFGYRVLSRFSEADLKSKTDPKAGALAFDALAADSALDSQFRDAAKLRAALLRLDTGEIDAAKGALEALTAPDGAYRITARLTLASLALQSKDYAGAGKQLDLVFSDPEAPSNEKHIAEMLLGAVAANAPAK